jgi:hypothetical protein
MSDIHDEARIMEIVELAVSTHRLSCPLQDQITELGDEVEATRRWQRAMYSNGSGGPPGFIELFEKRVTEQIAALSAKIETAHDFQEGRKGELRQESKDKRREMDWRNFWLAVLTFIIGGLSIVLVWKH